MSNTDLKRFMEDIMAINADYAGMGGASAAIVGATGTNDHVTYSLRENVLAFAEEYRNKLPNQDHLIELSGQLEGSLRSLQLIGAISDQRFEELIAQLDVLMNTKSS